MTLYSKTLHFILLTLATILMLIRFAYAQIDDSKNTDPLAARDALGFADYIHADKESAIYKALENRHNKDLGIDTGNKEEEKKDGNYIQCGESVCDISTHYCYNVEEQRTSGSIRNPTITHNAYYKCYSEEKESYGQLGDDYYIKYTLCTSGCAADDFKIAGMTLFKGDRIEMYGSDGNKYWITLGDSVSVKYANEGAKNGSIRGCEVLPVKLYNYRKCFFCPLVGTIYDGVAKITDISFQKMAGALATLLALGFGIWIAVQVLTQVSSLTKQDAPKFLGNLLRQGYKVLIAFLLLQYSTQVFTYVINPILETGLTFGKSMLTTRDIFSELDKDDNGNYLRQAKFVAGGKHLQLDTYDKIEQYVVAVQQHLAFMQTIGTSLTCIGGNLMLLKETVNWWHKIFKPSKVWAQFSVGVQIMAQGLVITIFAFLLSLAFTFYLIDAIVQVGVVGGLLPFIIACWPFKATTKYTSTGVGMLMNSAFLFLFVGLIMSANLMLVDEALSVGHTSNGVINQQEIDSTAEIGDVEERCSHMDFYTQNRELCDNTGEGTLYKMGMAINSQDAAQLKALADISSMGFFILLFCCIFGFKFTNQAKPLADKFAKSGTGQPIAPGIATMATSFTKSAAAKITEPTRDAIGRRTDRLIKAVVNAPYDLTARLYHKIRGRDRKPDVSGQSIGNTPTGSNNPTGGNPNGGGQAQDTKRNPTLNEGAGGKKQNILNEGGGTAGGKRLNEGDYQEPEDENIAGNAEAENGGGTDDTAAPETEAENRENSGNESGTTPAPGGNGKSTVRPTRPGGKSGAKGAGYSQPGKQRKAKGGSGKNRKYGKRK